MTAVPDRKGRFAALQSRNFTLLWVGLIVSNAGTWMQNVASGWLVLQLTNSPLWLGLLGLSFALPMMVLPLLGGAVVDRVHRIRLLYITQTGSMLVAFALAILTWLNMVTVGHIFVASFLGAALLAFDNPARQALIPELVPPGDLLNALSLNSATYNGAALIGPALAGALLAPLGAGTLFFLNGVSFLSVILALMGMRGVRSHSGGKSTSLRAAMVAGFSYAWHNRLVFVLLMLSALSAFFGRSYQTLLPIFARDIWNAGPEGYGALLSAGGAGALVGAFGLAAASNLKRRALVLVASGLIGAAALIAFALSPAFLPGIALLFIASVATTVLGTLIATTIQVAIPNEMRGRVMSLYAITLIGLPSLGALGIGSGAELLGGVYGAPRAVLVGAIIMAVVLLLFARYVLKNVPEGKPAAPRTEPARPATKPAPE